MWAGEMESYKVSWSSQQVLENYGTFAVVVIQGLRPVQSGYTAYQ